uniref:G-protein coupled receptors family 1 profile domain-containing protein n=1 Tax=Monodon monoceros TaxID=40151 RepID=A0A8C6FBA8_MONMO
MTHNNIFSVTEFILAGLTNQPGLQILGNLGLITLIGLNSHLHIPMYFFLFNLSFTDFSFSTAIIPKMLTSFVPNKNIISYAECMTQLFFFCFFVFSEPFILSAMAYDRYVAICKPLVYRVTMSPQVCLFLLLGVYGMGVFGAVAHIGNMVFLTFCAGNLVNHYMCDIIPFLELSCNSSYINILVVFIAVTIGIGVIFHISSTEGRSKAFSTCSFHIIAVSLFFGSGAFTYLKSPSISPLHQGKVSSLFYTIVAPMFNPLIYSLRNKDVKFALKKTLGRITFS